VREGRKGKGITETNEDLEGVEIKQRAQKENVRSVSRMIKEKY
jgi:hypothetical protein